MKTFEQTKHIGPFVARAPVRRSGVALIACALALGPAVSAWADGLKGSSEWQAAPLGERDNGLPAPEWSEHSSATQQEFIFATDDLAGGPDFDSNPFGESAFQVDAASGSWQEPGASLTREDNGGAWELFTADSITLTVPLADSVEPGASFELFINAVVFNDGGNFYDVPSFEGQGGDADILDQESSVVEEGGGPFDGDWEVVTWNASVANLTGTDLDFVFGGLEESVALIDSLEVYTAVPEPGAYAAIAGLAALVVLVVLVVRRLRKKSRG